MEGSRFIVDRVKRDHPNVAPNIRCGDFCEQIPFRESFDLVVDRLSVACNEYSRIRDCISKVTPRMKEASLFIGVDWPSTESDYSEQGDRCEDGVTCANYESGPFRDMGSIHFVNKTRLLQLFGAFEVVFLEHKTSAHEDEAGRSVKHCSWNFRHEA